MEETSKLNTLMEVVHNAYPDEITREYWDSEVETPKSSSGDTLAEFIVRELADVYDKDQSLYDNADLFIFTLERAVKDIKEVIYALKDRQDTGLEGDV